MARLHLRRRIRRLVLVVGAVLTLVTASGCQPPPHGVEIARNIAWIQLKQRGWTNQAGCLVNLWSAESSWNVYAVNRSSGAYGIPQALPAKRMASAGRDWATNPATQIRWGLTYIAQRYGGPCNAWRHERIFHWYLEPATTDG